MGTRTKTLIGALALVAVVTALIAVSALRSPQASQTSEASPAALQSPVVTSAPPDKIESTVSPTLSAAEPVTLAPFAEAPLCPDSADLHDNSRFHTLWDAGRGCHYDHEHGESPFTEIVAQTFPGFDLLALTGSVEVGHTNPSSEMENTHKHGGFKWDVTLSHPMGCAGREDAPTGVDAFVIQYHAFGNYAVEFESRIHSALALMRQCHEDNPTDFGYLFVNQHQDYGQRVSPYQGVTLPYPDSPAPAYEPAREPYFSVDCFGGAAPCDKYPSLDFIVSRNVSADSTWISEPDNLSGSGSPLFALLFRLRDSYQMVNATDQSYPFTFAWLCSNDSGTSYYSGDGCVYNNTTTRVHELIGEIPAAWDNLEGFDMDPRAGRITGEAYVTRFGELNLACSALGPDCHPIKLVEAFTGHYGTSFTLVAGAATFGQENLPERDIYFCGPQVCAEDSPGAIPSGWLSANN